MVKPKHGLAGVEANPDEQSPYVVSHGVTKMVIETELSPDERAALDARIHAIMDMEGQVQFHLDMFKKQLGERLKKLVARRLALHIVWKKNKAERIIDVEVTQDDRTHEVRRTRVDTGELVTRRTLDQREQLGLFQGQSSYLPELDASRVDQHLAEQRAEEEETAKLLADIDWSEIQASLAQQLGLTVEELAASAGDRSAKAGKKTKKRGKKTKDAEDNDKSEGEDNGEEES